MQKIVTNTGPIVALATLDLLGILKELFNVTVVPAAVHEEVVAGQAGLSCYRAATWLQTLPLQNAPNPLLSTVLDAGEAAVIQTAREQSIDLVLIDELKARKIARTVYGLRVIGTARVLVDAKARGLVPSVRLVLEDMRANGYWLHDDIVTLAARMAGE